MKKNILFVDSDPQFLEGIENRLRRQRRRYEVTFALGPEEGVAAIERQNFEVVVSDMRMPGMDGAEFLGRVRKTRPDAIRIIFTGQSDQEALVRALPVAHQFLTKPCAPGDLEQLLTRCCRVKDVLENDVLRSAVGTVDSLPAGPELYGKLTRMLNDPEVALRDVADLVAQDIGISGRILQMVNSSYFSRGRAISEIHEAASYLGVDTLKQLVLTAEVFKTFESVEPKTQNALRWLQHHAMKTGRIAAKIAPQNRADEAFTAGLLHDVGLFFVALHLPEHFDRIVSVDPEVMLHDDLERETNGFTHAEAGAYLLTVWDLPYPLVEAVAFHHRPDDIEHSEFGILSAVYVANHIADEGTGPIREQHDEAQLIDYLARFDMVQQLGPWRKVAEKIGATDGEN